MIMKMTVPVEKASFLTLLRLNTAIWIALTPLHQTFEIVSVTGHIINIGIISKQSWFYFTCGELGAGN